MTKPLSHTQHPLISHAPLGGYHRSIGHVEILLNHLLSAVPFEHQQRVSPPDERVSPLDDW